MFLKIQIIALMNTMIIVLRIVIPEVYIKNKMTISSNLMMVKLNNWKQSI